MELQLHIQSDSLVNDTRHYSYPYHSKNLDNSLMPFPDNYTYARHQLATKYYTLPLKNNTSHFIFYPK